MSAVRALLKRVTHLERAAIPSPSPLVVLHGSFDLFVEITILPGIESGALDRTDMIDIVASLRRWESDGTWNRAKQTRIIRKDG